MNGNSYLVINLAGADGTDESFAYAGNLSLGVNILHADEDGVFVKFPDTDLTGKVAMPTKDHETNIGWRATECFAFADYTEKFHFKGD